MIRLNGILPLGDIYILQLPSGGDDDDNFYLMPVMVFINGDEFQLEDASSTTFGPQRFMNKDVVLVVPHYRVGVFGVYLTYWVQMVEKSIYMSVKS